ncbi:EF-hand domain-containing protein [Flavobacterium rhizosphaerae]|uniref:EF-hand domain-containing protein n=1 Tax=Flavobacterium rhizosphaerae TaxID=3163298 RepID=A0ABW8Z1A3_9FLAO
MTTTFFKIMAAGCILAASPAFAQEDMPVQKRTPEKMFEKLDADGDGKISMAEAEKAPKGRLKENFATIDTNKDTYLDKEELKTYRKERMAKRKSNK